MQWKMADEFVVVMKFRPMKPGNSVEDKTGMTCSLICRAVHSQNHEPYTRPVRIVLREG